METFNRVVLVAFIENGKILVVKSVRSAKQNLYTLIGGTAEPDEPLLEAAIREIKEEINPNFDIKQKDLKEILQFIEPAASNPELMIEIHLFLANKKIDCEFINNYEIIEHHWYDASSDQINVSSAIKDHLLIYAKQNNLIR